MGVHGFPLPAFGAGDKLCGNDGAIKKPPFLVAFLPWPLDLQGVNQLIDPYYKVVPVVTPESLSPDIALSSVKIAVTLTSYVVALSRVNTPVVLISAP